MAKRLAVPSKELQLFVIGPLGSFKASRVQKTSFGQDIPSTTVDELGNSLHVGESKDTPNVTLSFSAFDVGIKVFSALTGTDSASYPGGGVDIAELGEVDAAYFVKDPDTAVFAKSGHGRRLQVRDFSFSYTVDGESTEDYTLIGSEKRWFKYDVVAEEPAGSGVSFTLTETPIQLRNGNYVLSIIADGNYLTEVTGAPDEGEYLANGVGNKTITLNAADTVVSQLIAVYHSDASTAWADVGDASMPSAIKGKDAVVSILANDIPRVQSVTINGNMQVQGVKQMGSRDIVGYQRQVPTIEGSITVLDTDTDLISLLTYGTIGSGVEWQPGEGCDATPVALIIELQDPCDTTTAPYTILKSIEIPSITIVGDSYSVNTGGNASSVFNFKSTTGSLIIYSGAIAP
ncbi:TPA: hypothetical protein DCQ22_00640 [Candidatus Nomurabacteria bacterium]|nr:hypothetical protein [Candidatus Nomurabacteria bacterium]